MRFVFTGLGLILAPEKRTNQTHPHVRQARTRAPSREGSVRCSCRCHRQLCGHLLFIGIFPCFLQQNFHPLCSLVASASLFGPEPQFLAPVLTPFPREGKTCAVGKAHKKYGWLLFSCLRAKIFKRAFFSSPLCKAKQVNCCSQDLSPGTFDLGIAPLETSHRRGRSLARGPGTAPFHPKLERGEKNREFCASLPGSAPAMGDLGGF